MQVYELLRPGRAKDKTSLLEAARKLRAQYSAERMARFVEEAAEVYDRRGLFRYRF
jgi:glycerol dehydratase small subunit/propanediol dehydratase small subunit